ncbi:MAG TPA: alpha/beta hydrolase [Longimicrobium sp.]|nr:alpha/beta hydrolase [Longimicrobium sp.]
MFRRPTAALAAALSLAACSDSPTVAPAALPSLDAAGAPFSYDVPTADGYLAGADGVRLHYRVVGTGPDTVVVLHGGPGLEMGYLTADLAPLAHGRTLIYYDQRGGGRSQGSLDPAFVGVDRQVADLEAVRAHFGLEKMSLVGHSWGALLAGLYARQHADRLERLVLLNPAPVSAAYWAEFDATIAARAGDAANARMMALIGRWIDGTADRAACEEYLTLRFATYFTDPAKVGALRGAWCDVPEEVARVLLPVHLTIMATLGDFDLRGTLGHVAAPTLVVHGTGDAVPFASSRDYADAIPGARLLVLDGVGHFPWMEDPVPFFTAVNQFLRTESPRS